MARKGREFEMLIMRLESAAKHVGARVESPYAVHDPTSDARREIDVAVIGADGTVLVALECRDRAKKAGLDWIEQLITKAQAIGARRMVAVSRSGFTEGAQRRAEGAGMDLRTIARLADEDFVSWMPRVAATPFSLEYPLTAVCVIPVDPTKNALIDGMPLTALHLTLGDQAVTLRDLFLIVVLKRARRFAPELRRDQVDARHEIAYLLDGVASPEANKIVRIDFPEHDLVARTAQGEVTISRIELVFDIRVAFLDAAEVTSGKYVGQRGDIRGYHEIRITPPGSSPDLGVTVISRAAPGSLGQ